ncbi:hypothetical protein CFOL_v3_31952 [Cephalotus follicularis]|uniref:Uncharacterized protein n=1 Tax=Cephalotus follicularis TaxID=3775 RepID=A0A1Q3D7T2_CEPFO|nr:hypothetical protein CFOL_v3_31952 [Cephalotus follicularis]
MPDGVNDDETVEKTREFDHMSVTITEPVDSGPVGAAIESHSTDQFLEISIHALAGHSKPGTLRNTGRCKHQTLQMLIDNGITHNVFKESVAYRLGLSILPCKTFKVFVGNGQYLDCSQKCESLVINL